MPRSRIRETRAIELSLVMLINRLTSIYDFEKLSEIPKEYFEHLEEKSSEEILEVLSQVVTLLLCRLNLPREEVYSVTDKIWKGEMDIKRTRKGRSGKRRPVIVASPLQMML